MILFNLLKNKTFHFIVLGFFAIIIILIPKKPTAEEVKQFASCVVSAQNFSTISEKGRNIHPMLGIQCGFSNAFVITAIPSLRDVYRKEIDVQLLKTNAGRSYYLREFANVILKKHPQWRGSSSSPYDFTQQFILLGSFLINGNIASLRKPFDDQSQESIGSIHNYDYLFAIASIYKTNMYSIEESSEIAKELILFVNSITIQSAASDTSIQTSFLRDYSDEMMKFQNGTSKMALGCFPSEYESDLVVKCQ